MAEHDKDLIRKVASGDHGAFERLVERWEGPLISYFRRLTGNNHDAEDLFQEAFIKVFKSAGTFNAKSCGFSGWIYTISHNLVCSFFRRRKSEQKRVRKSAEMNSSIHSMDVSENEKIPFNEIDSIFQDVPFSQRNCLELRYFQGLSYREIAEVTSLSVNTVKSNIYTGMRRLREQVNRRILKD